MATNFKENNTEETKFNISSVVSGKDILSLTRVLGEMIDGNGTNPTNSEEGTKKICNKTNEIKKNNSALHKGLGDNVQGRSKVEFSKTNTTMSSDHNDSINSQDNKSVENFRELFSYRKPILLEELEKARRSLSEEALLNEEVLVNEETTNDQTKNNDNITTENTKLIETTQEKISTNEVTTEEIIEPISQELEETFNNNELNISFDIEQNQNKDQIILDKELIEDEFRNRNTLNLSNDRPRIEFDDVTAEPKVRLINENIDIEKDNNNIQYEELDNTIIHNEEIEPEPESLAKPKNEKYTSTQATLARQRITELMEQKEENHSNNHTVLELGIEEKNTAVLKPVNYKLPQWSLLSNPPNTGHIQDSEDSLNKALLLEETLSNFGVKAQVTNYSEGPTITRFEIQPAPGVKVSRIVNLADDIALCLAAGNVRIEAPIPGKSAVGIEVPNHRNQAVHLKEIITDGSFVHGSSKIMVALGKDIAGKPTVADLSRMPHLLIAGSTGSGKSVCMNSIITSILFRANPDEVKFLMVDPKMVELSVYNGIPHLISPVITDPKKATAALKWVVNEMENRYNLFASNAVRNIESYNKLLQNRNEKPLPFVVVLIDELADLMMVASRDVEESICRLAQKARAAGIHLVIATQRPSVDVITGIIKANIPSRIAFAVSSQIDSRTILDLAGAEKLLGRGDMLFSPIGTSKPVRVQGVYVSDEEVEEVVSFWKSQGKPEYEAGVLQEVETSTNGVTNNEEDDELLSDAIKLILQSGQASVSLLQRRFRIGYTRAARLIDLMEERGIIGGYEGSKPRSVLMSLEDWLIENGE